MSENVIHSFVAFLVLTTLIFLNAFGIISPILDAGRITANVLTKPAVAVLQKFKNLLDVLFHVRDMAAQNHILSTQVGELTSELAILEKFRQENKVLREALGFQAESRHDLIPAQVIVYDLFNADQRVTLNRGSDYGVAVNDAVVMAGQIFVGVITSVSQETSQMELVSSSAVVINAQTVPGTATGVVRGEHGLGLLFDLVSQKEVLKEGERVITSGLGGTFPANLLVGTIGEIRSGSSDLFQKASIVPGVDLRNVRIVFIVKK